MRDLTFWGKHVVGGRNLHNREIWFMWRKFQHYKVLGLRYLMILCTKIFNMTKVLWEKFQMDNVLGLRNSVLLGQNLAKSIRSDIGLRKFLFRLMKGTLVDRACSCKWGNQIFFSVIPICCIARVF